MCFRLSLEFFFTQDKYDDMLIGVKSTALKFGDQTKVWLTGFGTAMVSLLVLTGKMCDQTWPYYSAVSLTAAHIAHQVYTYTDNSSYNTSGIHLH
jgi:4-hydroxybenzoate polyprenyltransferase